MTTKTDVDYINAISVRNSMLSYIDFHSRNETVEIGDILKTDNIYDIIKAYAVSHNKYIAFIDTINPQTPSEKYQEYYKSESNSIYSSDKKHEEVFEYSKMNIMNALDSAKLSSKTDYFIRLLRITDFEEGMDNEVTEYFAEVRKHNQLALKDWFGKTFLSQWNDEEICMKMLMLLCDYSYEEFNPVSQTIALASKDHPSKKVASAAMNLFGHWANEESLNYLITMKEPQEYWLRIKRETIINDIKSHLCM